METEKIPVFGIQAKLSPVRTASGLAPIPAIYEKIYEVEKSLTKLFAPQAFCLRVYLDRLQIFCRAETAEDILAIYQKTIPLLHLLDEENAKLSAENATFYFRYFIAEDFQLTSIRRIPPLSVCPDTWLFTGTLPERLEKITGNSPAKLSSPFLITHALYEKLPEQIQSRLNTCYYIMHICCYTE